MGLERFYTDAGRPAFIKDVKAGKRAAGLKVSIVYARAYDFQRLWDKAGQGGEEELRQPPLPGILA